MCNENFIIIPYKLGTTQVKTNFKGEDMKRALIIGLFLLINQTAGNCASTLLPPLQPINQENYSQAESSQDYANLNDAQTIDAENNKNYTPDEITSLPDPFVSHPTDNLNNSQDIGKIEQALFGRTFTNQNLATRLSRIEKSLFSTTYQNSSPKQRIDNIISNYNQVNKMPNISTNELSRLESKVFRQSFTQANPQMRIERLEQQIFGAIQSGDLNARLDALKIVVKNYNPKKQAKDFDTFSGMTMPRMQRAGWGGLSGFGLGDSFSNNNYMTGFTPPISPYDYNRNMNPYSPASRIKNNYDSYANPYRGVNGAYQGSKTNNGIYGYHSRESYENLGTGCGVHIID